MKIDVIISADHIKPEYLKDKIVVVIDMLRATSVITTALFNGAKRVIPTLTVEEAFEKGKILKSKGEAFVLGGERQALKIEGFNFSNSPLEYTKECVQNKTVIITTTNGTRALNLCKKADKILIGAMINAKKVAKKLKELNKDVIFINAGTNGKFSMDDFICSGYMINELLKEITCDLSDIAKTANLIYEGNKNIINYIKNATHYEILKSLDLEKDLEYCSSKDIIDIVPLFDGEEIK
ncbi:2-phosphosulfolactate phosphatase family protein [Clostridium tarantellae]|uniref:Probable 2-phosphosulfolactate phosphatase n=1 Tax=Clostridium tarantellae TaxID=39493 RepID=A0A6I1MJ93_9CLOT|nr:2-phosphosulfolactate phosphatase family protein [Clostridium tarantellae]MPQ43455.1 2-phosphosulfolactate phosphatase family protein [Clostridium tarantellae]